MVKRKGDMRRGTVLGIDVGATKVRIALVSPQGRPGEGATFAVPRGVKPDGLAKMIAGHASELMSRSRRKIIAAGAGVPGHVTNDRRTLLATVNIGWGRTRFAQILERRLGVPAVLENDVNAAALGEQRYGAAKGALHVICLFVGTGLGGGVVTGGKLLRGATGNAGELGHLLFRMDGRTCGCGRRGCVEAYAAGSNISEHYRDLTGTPGLNPSQVSERALGGDKVAVRVMKDARDALVTLIVSLQTTFDAEFVVLGGGVIDKLGRHFEEVRKQACAYFTGMWKSPVRIVRSKLGPDAGVLGAAALARELF